MTSTLDRPPVTRQPVLPETVWLAYALPAALALAFSLAFSWRPSLWRDETASVSASTRSWGQLWHMLANVDAVHGSYYALLHPVASVSIANWWLRLPSALAVAGTAALIVALGRQLADLRTGFAAAVLWAFLPVSSRYGQEVRSTALGVCITAAATVVLIGAMRRNRVRWWVAYALLMALGGYVFLFSLLAVAGHLVVVVVSRRDARRAVVRFVVAVAAAAVIVSPLVAVSRGQLAGQLSWATTPPRLSDLPTLSWSLWFANRQLGLLVWVMVGVAVIAATRARPGPRVQLLTVGLGIGLLPALALLLASEVRPAFAARYVASGAVFLCLLAGYGLTRARGRWMIVVSLVAAVGVAGLALPHWHSDRTRAGHGEDVSAIADVLRNHRAIGDGVVWQPTLLRTDATAYPAAFTGLVDLGLDSSPNASGTLTGTEVSLPTFTGQLDRVDRVWVIHLIGRRGAPSAERVALVERGFRVQQSWGAGQTGLDLMTR